MRQNLKSLRAREQNMFEWRQEPCQIRNITDKVSLPKVTRNHTKPLSLKRKHKRKNRHASGLNENGSILSSKGLIRLVMGWFKLISCRNTKHIVDKKESLSVKTHFSISDHATMGVDR